MMITEDNDDDGDEKGADEDEEDNNGKKTGLGRIKGVEKITCVYDYWIKRRKKRQQLRFLVSRW